jgi:predicted nucleic acid-binding protein
MTKVLFDVNVIMDVLQLRKPFIEYSGPALQLVEDGEIQGFLCASSIDTLFYLISAQESKQKTITILRTLRSIFEIAPVDEEIIDLALKSNWKDVEDAILYFSARKCGCSYLLTRNEKDFRKMEYNLRVLSPAKFLEQYGK